MHKQQLLLKIKKYSIDFLFGVVGQVFCIFIVTIFSCPSFGGIPNNESHGGEIVLQDRDIFSVVKKSIGDILTITGEVSAVHQLALSSLTHGRIIKMNCLVGQRIPRNELVAELDVDIFQWQLQTAEAQLTQEREQLRVAERQLYNAKDLLPKGLISPLSHDQFQLQKNISEAQIISINAQIQSLNKQMTDASIVVPFDAYVIKKYADVGQVVSSGMPLCGLIEADNVEVLTYVSSANIRLVHVGQRARFYLQGIKDPLIAHVVRIGSIVSSVSRAIPIYFQFSRLPNHHLLDTLAVGFFLTGELEVSNPQSAIVVPRDSVRSFTGDEQPYVYLITPKGLLEKRLLVVGPFREREQEIVVYKGLQEGDQIVSLDLGVLSVGHQVILFPAQPQAIKTDISFSHNNSY